MWNAATMWVLSHSSKNISIDIPEKYFKNPYFYAFFSLIEICGELHWGQWLYFQNFVLNLHYLDILQKNKIQKVCWKKKPQTWKGQGRKKNYNY